MSQRSSVVESIIRPVSERRYGIAGSAAPTKTPIACCDSIFLKEAICRYTARPRGVPLPGNATNGQEKRSNIERPQSISKPI